ncbi:MAG: hypothetical protein KZQ58_08510 [gamma proteobacterium symbiont of Bathyaustriella thionipta]|nr:hypothetical protein [gamma proteobacterium symbiont of Bathyaustriella thionipta]
MIDIHSHILPAIDDGASSVEMALQMLRLAAQDGVRLQCLTPHIHLGRYENSIASLQQAFDHFKQQVQQANIDIDLNLAAEVRIAAEIMPLVISNELLWLGEFKGRKVMLLEMPHNLIPVGCINMIQWLLKQGIQPLLVHPERNRELQQAAHKIQDFLQAGCLLQITAGSLCGHFGLPARQFSEQLLRQDHVFAIATDCHNLDYRPPDLAEGRQAAEQLIGVQAAAKLVHDNPASLFAGQAC